MRSCHTAVSFFLAITTGGLCAGCSSRPPDEVVLEDTGTDGSTPAIGGGGNAGHGGSGGTAARPEGGAAGTAGGAGATGDAGPPRLPGKGFAVLEQDFRAPAGDYANPWEDVTVVMTVTSPSGRSTTVGGFYHQGTTYKARFRPDEAGRWTWTATISDKAGTSQTSSGTFDATPDGGHGFIRKSQDNPNRWKWDDGTPYYGLGLQSWMPRVDGIDTSGGYNGGLDLGLQPVSLDTFLSTSGGAGFNMLRFMVACYENCAPGVWQTLSPGGNTYGAAESIYWDRVLTTARQQGFALLITIFNYWSSSHRPPYFESATLADAEAKALQRYAQYLINRYSAYIDIWEAVNEGNGSAAWYATVIPYIKRNDPYRHDITTSTVFALGPTEYASGVTVNMMHWYVPLTEDVAAKWTYANIRDWKAAGEAGGIGGNTILGETGNCCSVCNYGPVGFRLRNWAAFFAEGINVYWDDASAKTACGGANTNYYIGEEERASAGVLQSYSDGFDPKAKIDSDIAVDTAGVTAYALSGPVDYGAYLVADDHTAPTSGVKVTVCPQSAGRATWFDPSTGAHLAESGVAAGRQTLDVPAFTTDVALKIHRP